MAKLAERFPENPLLSPGDVTPSRDELVVECAMNPGVFEYDGMTWLAVRVAERPVQKEAVVSLPVIGSSDLLDIIELPRNDPGLDISDSRHVYHNGDHYLSTLSHLRLFCSEDGIHFREPSDYQSIIEGKGPLERYGIEDCRVSKVDGTYLLTFTSVSDRGVGVSLITTRDWSRLERKGLIFLPHNKDCAIFEEKINGKYFCFNRPSGLSLGGNFIWISSSPDLIHWGGHHCILKTRPGSWDSERVGAGAAPIKTERGWLAIYHGYDGDRYCLGAILLDLQDPSLVLRRSVDPIMVPETDYEINGFYGNVVFTNGHIVKGDKLTMYYGAADTCICAANFSIKEILHHLLSSTITLTH